MEYLLKASAVIAIFYFIYKVFLQRDTFFKSNRGFLLSGLIIAFTVPFLVIPIYIEYNPTLISTYNFGDVTVIENIEEPFNILDYLPIVYLLGVLFFSIRFIIQSISLATLIFKNKSEKQGVFSFVKTNTNVSPFSFFKWIVYNPNQFNKNELDQIIMHEKVHARQYHSIDILLTQLSCVVLWFNPFIWLYNKDLKQNLEFLADSSVITNIKYKKDYQYTLLKTSLPTHQLALSNNFYNSLIKKRIVMLHKSKSKKINLIKYAFVIPLLAIFLMSFNTEDIYVHIKQTKTSSPTNNLKIDTIKSDYKVIITKDLTDIDLKRITKEAEKEGVKLTFKKIKRNSNNEIIKISAEFKNSEGSFGNYNLNGNKPIKSFFYEQTKGSFGFSTERQPKFIKDRLFENDTILNNSKKNLSEIKITGYEDSILPTKSGVKTNPWKLSSERNNVIALSKDTLFISDKPNILEKTVNGFNESPLFLLDGKEVSKKEIDLIDQQDIHSISTIKDVEQNIKKYGEKAKNGVVIIKLRNKGTKKTIVKLNSSALYIINGKEVKKEALEDIAPNNIESINVIKDKTATKKYGDKGKNGVIEITTKKGKNKKIQIRGTNSDTPPLYILDGKEVKKEAFENIDHDNIESINVIKGKAATKKYSDKGKNGVIEITTKKGKNKKIQIRGTNSDTPPLYILDGKEVKKEAFEDIDHDNIESINVIKDIAATKKYGVKGKNGVVEITTKKE